MDKARAIVSALLEDIEADLPSHKSEVRILPTDSPNRFDVTLLTGFDPIYIGTIAFQGRSWKPVEVMPGVGRQLRTRLHFIGPDKESVAMTMVEVLKPIWKRQITRHLITTLESEDEEFDTKRFIQQKVGYEHDIKRVIEANYPNIEVLEVKPELTYRLRYEALIKSKDPAQPLWHSPIYAMIKDLEVKIADVYNWKLRPYANQENYPEFRRTGKPVGILPIGISYNNTPTPGVFVLYIDFNILQQDQSGGYQEQADWGIPYGLREDLSADIAKEAEKAEKPESPEQAEAGNYRKGHISLHGFQIAIENAKGSTRSGTGKDGKTWKVTMPAHYGYIKGTQGKDKDHLDVYIGPEPEGIMAFVVNQVKEEGGFDEHKIMLGFSSKDEAIEHYDRAFTGNLGPKLRDSVVSTTVDKLKEWIASGNTKKPFEGLAETLLENEEEFGLDFIKKLALRVKSDVPEGTEFHIGFSVGTSDQHMIEMRAADDGIDLDDLLDPNGEIDGPTWWDAINAAMPVIERNAEAILDQVGITCRNEGHDSTGDLVGSAWVTSGSLGFEIVKEFAERDEPFSTSSGSIGRFGPNVPIDIYKGVPEQVAPFIDVDISFFDLNHEAMGIGEAEEEPELSFKKLAMNPKVRVPRTYNDLKVGDVLYHPEVGAYERIEAKKPGYSASYQDEDGNLHHDSRPTTMVYYSQFGPAYAYGHYVQNLSVDGRHGLLGGAMTVDVADNSDEALWRLVDEETIKDGRATADELAAERQRHQAWLAEPAQVAQREAEERLQQMMGRRPR